MLEECLEICYAPETVRPSYPWVSKAQPKHAPSGSPKHLIKLQFEFKQTLRVPKTVVKHVLRTFKHSVRWHESVKKA